MSQSNTQKFREARDYLLKNRLDYNKVIKEFKWPVFDDFNWARDWFDVYAGETNKTALWIKRDGDTDSKLTYAELSERSNKLSSYLQRIGVQKGDRIIVLLPNIVATWEMNLAAIKIGAVLVPTSVLATKSEITDRISRCHAKFLVTETSCMDKISDDFVITKILVGPPVKGWLNFEDAYSEKNNYNIVTTKATDPLLLYFTSGTTSKAKLVQHTHQSYPVGHFSSMYWIGIQENDIHQNISSPGWAKHAWSSFFAPFNAGATNFVHDYARFDAKATINNLSECKINTLCAPPTVWRMLILEELGKAPSALREAASAGEPLNPEVIEEIQAAWGITIRDGYGQSETTAQIGNTPGQFIKLGSMGRPLPGYSIALLDADYNEVKDGEVAIRLAANPIALMDGYMDDMEKTKDVMKNGFYRTGDEATMDKDGYIFFVGRGDDVFKSSDYRISPFELESVLIEHPHVAEAAVVPSPDDLRTNLPKAFIALVPGVEMTKEVAEEILMYAKEHLPPYKRIRKVEFTTLPKTISGKIRRVELRNLEKDRVKNGVRGENEYFLSDFNY